MCTILKENSTANLCSFCLFVFVFKPSLWETQGQLFPSIISFFTVNVDKYVHPKFTAEDCGNLSSSVIFQSYTH